MSLNVFMTICILGIDFMIYVFFQWTYGDKRRAMALKIAAHRNALKEQSGLLLLAEGKPTHPTASRFSQQRIA